MCPSSFNWTIFFSLEICTLRDMYFSRHNSLLLFYLIVSNSFGNINKIDDAGIPFIAFSR